MMKKNKRMLLITSVAILLPILAGMVLWDDLPDKIAIHFGADNQPNGWSSKAFAVFGLPAITLGLHWIAVLGTAADAKRKNINEKMMTLFLWICPSISLVLSALTYTYAMGMEPDIGFFVMLLLGVLFMVLGNYLPKCRQNYTVGIRLWWTLNDPANWQRTQRVAGWSMSIGGVLILATAYFRIPWLFFAIVCAFIFLPIFYSYLCYRRGK